MSKIFVLLTGKRGLRDPKTGGEFYFKQVLDFLQTQGVSIKVISVEEDLPRVCNRKYILANIIFVWKLLIKGKPKAIILEDFYMHPWLFLFNWIAFLSGRCRLATFVQLFYHKQQSNIFLNAVDKVVASLFLRPVHLVFANSHYTAKECMRLGVRKERIVIIYPGCDFTGELISQKLTDHNNNIIRLLNISNYVPRKGLHYLVEAMSIIQQWEPGLFKSLELRIAGNSKDNPLYTQRLINRLESAGLHRNIHLLGWCTREQLKSLLAQADIFVLPSLDEGFGMVLAEAMCYGLPIIASRAGAILELIDDGVNGLLVEPKDVKGLAKAIIHLAKEVDIRVALGRNGRERSPRFVHSWNEVGNIFYKKILALAKQ